MLGLVPTYLHSSIFLGGCSSIIAMDCIILALGGCCNIGHGGIEGPIP